MRRHATTLPLLAVLPALLLAGPARAQMDSREGIALQNQILQLRAELQQVEQQQGQGGGYQPAPYRAQPAAPSGGGGELVAQLLDRVSQLEDQVRSLRGRLDQVQNQQQQMGADLSKQIGDLSFQVGQRGAGAAPAAPAATASGSAVAAAAGLAVPNRPAPAAAPAAPPRRTPEVALQDGNAAYGRHDYPAAEAAARDVVSGARGSPRATDAQYLLAQSEAAQRNWQQAAVDYYDAYNRAPKAARASEALLGVADALINLGDKRSACQALDKLRVEFPSPRSEVRSGVASARSRASCRG